MIPITKPFLPPKEEYEKILNGIWERQWLTNMGPLANELEAKLHERLQTNHLLFVTNGTIALQMAIKALELKGDIITTPFSFIATTSSIVWEGCHPIFVDIDKNTLNIDPTKIEKAITQNTTAILATHVFGNPCDVEAIQEIANKHNLKVIYDGAHAFDVKYKGSSIFNFGDISTCSLHATKLYHSGEGGLISSQDPGINKKLAFIRNFGFNGPEAFAELGINGKNSEFHAAMGLANFPYIDKILDRRKAISERYDKNLSKFRATQQVWVSDATKNYAYYPIIIESESLLLKCMDALKKENVYVRRYFYPSLANSTPYLESQSLQVTDDIAHRILCLPLYYDLDFDQVDRICKILLTTQIDN